MPEPGRYVFLVELTMEGRSFSSRELEHQLAVALPGKRPVVWGVVSGVDAAWRKLRQLSRETEVEDSLANRTHSAHKALSFFREMFPQSFWRFKLIGQDHPTKDERPMMAGR